MTDPIRPPAHVEPYVNILGEDVAVEFLLNFGGAELYFKWNTEAKTELVDLIGVDAVKRLAAAQSRLPRRVPKADSYIARVLITRGLTIAQVARKVRVTDNTVRSYLDPDRVKRPAPDYKSDQPGLFD